ncbi:MAG: hypothetical protein R2784_16500 [Saprospiraceae bacterium]
MIHVWIFQRGTPVIFRILPTATISGDQTICIGDTATLSLNLTGTGPWAVTYNNGSLIEILHLRVVLGVFPYFQQ